MIAGDGHARRALRLTRRLGGRGDSLPDRELALEKVEIDRDHLADYGAVCGFRLRDELPPTYLHVVAFPLALELMTGRDFPLKPRGLVHVANRIEQRRPIGAGEKLSLRVHAEGLCEHPCGTRFDVVVQAGDAWLERSTYLRREHPGKGGGDPEPPREASAVWRVTLRTARRYAAVSGDRNPIHLHRLAAWALGQPRPIAHGMWLKARCVAALEDRLPPACVIEVQFGAPLRLPATAGFSTWEEDGSRAFAVHGGRERRKHVTGRVTAV